MVDQFMSGIPNESNMPHLHVLSCRKMTVLQCPDLLAYCGVDKQLLNDVFLNQEHPEVLEALKTELKASG